MKYNTERLNEMEIKNKFSFETSAEHGGISVLKLSYIEFSGKELLVDDERRAFTPNQIEELKQFAPPLESVCRALWTPEVIAKWEEHIAELELNQ